MNPISFPLSEEQLTSLVRREPLTIAVGEGQVTLTPPEKQQGKRLRNLSELTMEVMAPVDCTLEFTPGVFHTFKIRGLDSDVAKEADDIGRSVQPPKKAKAPAGPRGIVPPDEYDYEDKNFLAQLAVVNAHRRAFVIAKGLIDFEIDGDTLDDKSKALRKLPPRVTEALYSAITALTSDPVKVADFS